ncbi:MAG: DNA-3-methyladenine glycosylase [Nitrospiraceae bacterium]
MSKVSPEARILTRAYFNRPALRVARSLLGKYLVRGIDTGLLAGRIVEVEAYVGPQDLACHASKGRTKRTDVLFGPPGVAYVYLIYGMYYCFNVVTDRAGYPAAVLVRAIEVYENPAQTGSKPAESQPVLIDGPGRLCRFLQIDLSLNRWDLSVGQTLWIEDRGERLRSAEIVATPRIGVDYAGEWATKLYRFRIQRTVSRRSSRSPQ